MTQRLADYKVLVGVEEELFIVNSRGFLAKASEAVSKELIQHLREDPELLEEARKYLFGLQWEPNPSQIEYVTLPTPIERIVDAVCFGRELLAKAAQNIGLLIYVGSTHPVQSTPLPINGTHINISIRKKNNKRLPLRALTYIYNNIRNHLPELIALSANSPVCAGEYTGFASSRLRYSKVLRVSEYGKIRRIPLSIVPRRKRMVFRYIILFNKPKAHEYKLVANQAGNRLLDITPRGPITNIIEDIRKSPRETRIEIRAIDNQSSEKFLSDIIKIIAGLALEALHKLIRGERIKERPQLIANREKAIRFGIDATFLINGESISAYEAVKMMLERISYYLDLLDLKLESPIARAIPEIKYYGAPKIIDEDGIYGRLLLRGKTIVNVRIGTERVLLDNFGVKKVLPPNSLVKGLLLRDYSLKWVSEKPGIIHRYKEIRRRYWLMMNEGYIRILPGDEIISAESAAQFLSNRLEKYLLE